MSSKSSGLWSCIVSELDTNVLEEYVASNFREEMKVVTHNWRRWWRGRTQFGPIGMIHSVTNRSHEHFLPEKPENLHLFYTLLKFHEIVWHVFNTCNTRPDRWLKAVLMSHTFYFSAEIYQISLSVHTRDEKKKAST